MIYCTAPGQPDVARTRQVAADKKGREIMGRGSGGAEARQKPVGTSVVMWRGGPASSAHIHDVGPQCAYSAPDGVDWAVQHFVHVWLAVGRMSRLI